jgi:hypothetical protein
MKQALFVLSGVVIGLLSALVALGCKTEFIDKAQAQAGPAGGNGTGGPQIIMGTGGATPNQNDLCWVYRQEKGKTIKGEYDRYVLSLYKAVNQGSAFDLVDTREITWDSKPSHLNVPGHNPKLGPGDLKQAWEKEQKEIEKRIKEEEERVRKDPPKNN